VSFFIKYNLAIVG